MHTNISNEDLLFPIVTNNPSTGLQDTTQTSGPPISSPLINPNPKPVPQPIPINAGPLSVNPKQPPRSAPPGSNRKPGQYQ
jgi:hypothetical protein